MARNRVQFQKGLSEAVFDKSYGTEEQCHAALVAWRWPGGFECPDCCGHDYCAVTRGARRLFQCDGCRKQTSVRAGTTFASSKLPLRIWFKAIYHVTQSKKGISSIELGRRLGITQTAAWMMKHKLGQVTLEGIVQMDDAYIGGAHPDRRGRGASGKTPFVAAVADITKAGLAAARKRGRKGGRPPAMDKEKIRFAETMLKDAANYPFVGDVIDHLTVGRTTFYRYFPPERIRELRNRA